MALSSIIARASKYMTDNSPAIMTGVAVAGTMATAYLTGRATVKAMEVIRAEEEEARESTGDDGYQLNGRRIAELCWQFYIPAAGTAVATIALIIAANRVGARRAAALAAAYAISEKAFDEYREKVVERLGARKEQEARDEIAQARITASPPSESLIWDETTNSVLCCDLFTGRYFMGDMESLRRAENQINYQVNNNYYASLSDFYDQVGLERTSMSDDFGWNADKLLELEFSTAMTPTGRPCLTVNFRVMPIRGFARLQ